MSIVDDFIDAVGQRETPEICKLYDRRDEAERELSELRRKAAAFDAIEEERDAMADPETLEDGFEHLYAAVDEGAKARTRLDALTAEGATAMKFADVADQAAEVANADPCAIDIAEAMLHTAREQLARCRAKLESVPVEVLSRTELIDAYYNNTSRWLSLPDLEIDRMRRVERAVRARLLAALSPEPSNG